MGEEEGKATPEQEGKRLVSEEALGPSKLVVYDLGSENLAAVQGKGRIKEVKKAIGTARIKSATRLRRLGAQTTESVLLVPPSRVPRIQGTMEDVQRIYAKLGEWLAKKKLDLKVKPTIKVVELSDLQAKPFTELAQEGLNARTLAMSRNLAKILKDIPRARSADKKESVRRSLDQQARAWEDLKEVAGELKLALPQARRQLDSMIGSAKEQVSEWEGS